MKWVPVIGISLAAMALAQPAGNRVQFEVASIKLVEQSDRASLVAGCSGGPGTADLTTWICPQITVAMLLVRAHGLEPYQFSIADWMFRTVLSITARIPAGTSQMQFREMQRNLLQDRFGLVFHWGQRDGTVYTLVGDKGGVKMRESAPDAPPAETEWGRVAGVTIGKDGFPVFPEGTYGLEGMGNHMRWKSSSVTVADLINVLQFTVGSDVVDGTGLTGKYDVDIHWQQPPPDIQSDLRPFDGPTIEKVLSDRLGLRLQPAKGSVKVFVVDHIAKTPTEN